jgi:hypothetical protein
LIDSMVETKAPFELWVNWIQRVIAPRRDVAVQVAF